MSKMSAQHTPGPWSYEVEKSSGPSLAEATFLFAHGDVIGKVYESAGHGNSQANARLIAAAPDLLEAAEQAQCQCSIRERDSGHRVGCWMPALSAAIAAASGKA